MFRLKLVQNLTTIFLSTFIASPVIAHIVEVSRDIAATFHLEPDHNPKAGETATVWFALTRRGGKTVPLSQCDCELFVYSIPRTENARPLMQPELKPISAERYREIPGTEIIFPRVGSYELELTGTAKNGAEFNPFTLTYTVNVGL